MDRTKTSRTAKTRGFLLATRDGSYIRSIDGDWGPSHGTTDDPLEADFFPAGTLATEVRDVERTWGAPLREVAAVQTETVELV